MVKRISAALVGAGSMGGALLRGWIEKAVIDPARSAVFDPAISEAAADLAGLHGVAINPPHRSGFDALVIAVKPQAAAAVLPHYADISRGTAAISVMAGKSVAAIATLLPGARCIIRAMPNLPAAVGAGVTGLYAAPSAGTEDRHCAQALMSAVGETVWVDSEQSIDAITAISGSGPAYFFLLGEALAQAAEGAGFSQEAAERLARATLEGAGAFAAQDARTLSDLRKAVTSPGGTTQAALEILDGDARLLRMAIAKAVDAARARAAELTD